MKTVENPAFEAVRRCIEEDGTLWIEGYKASDGEVANYHVTLVGHDGYIDLVKESMQDLVAGNTELNHGPTMFNMDVWQDAKREVMASWQKTLTKEHKAREQHEDVMNLAGVATKVGDDGLTVVLTNMRLLNKEVLQPAYERATTSKEKTQAKDWIRKNTALGRQYQGRLNLSPGKYDNIRHIPTPVTGPDTGGVS